MTMRQSHLTGPAIAGQSITLAQRLQQVKDQNAALIESLKQAERARDDLKIAVDQLAINNSDLSAQLSAARQVVDVARCSALADPCGRLAQAIEEYDRTSQTSHKRQAIDVRAALENPVLVAI